MLIVDETDDLPMLRRELDQALPQHGSLIFFGEHSFGIIGVVLDRIGLVVVQFLFTPGAATR